MHCTFLFLSFETKNLIENLETLKNYSVFSDLNPNLYLYSIVNSKDNDKFKKRAPQCHSIDKMCIFRAETHSFACSNREEKKSNRKCKAKAYKEGIKIIE